MFAYLLLTVVAKQGNTLAWLFNTTRVHKGVSVRNFVPVHLLCKTVISDTNLVKIASKLR